MGDVIDALQAAEPDVEKLRSSTVDVMRMSRIARMNLERGSEVAGNFEATAATAPAGDVRLNHPNAELDFAEQQMSSSSESCWSIPQKWCPPIL